MQLKERGAGCHTKRTTRAIERYEVEVELFPTPLAPASHPPLAGLAGGQ